MMIEQSITTADFIECSSVEIKEIPAFEAEEILSTPVPTELIEIQVRKHMSELGLEPAADIDIVMDGEKHFYQVAGDKNGKASGVYCVYVSENESPKWFIQDWRKGNKEYREFSVTFNYMTEEKQEINADDNGDDENWTHERRIKHLKELGLPANIGVGTIKNPNQLFFAQMFVYEHCENYIYLPNDGFYKYSDFYGIWEKQSEELVMKEIIRVINDDVSYNKVRGVLNLLKSILCTQQIMNPDNKLVLRNGTLNLDTLEFARHNKKNYATVYVDYDYDSNATCPEWEKFLNDVTAGDQLRCAVLQEVAGYIFCADNPVQAGVFLIGHGANGKSIYLETIKKVIGKHYVKVDLSSLDQPFQVIHLRHAWADISTELKADNPSTEAAFKNLVAGEDMTGCFKNKDFIGFQPRAKLIMACNEFPKWREQTGAMLRRMAYVKFPMRYVDDQPDPRAKNQREADASILKRLENELPGILNWALRGKTRLLTKKKPSFTKTKDYYEMLEQYQESANPVYAFVHECRSMLEGKRVERTEVYKAYERWAKETSHKPLSRNNFYISLNRIFAWEIGEDIKLNKVRGIWSYQFAEEFFFLDNSRDEVRIITGEEKLEQIIENDKKYEKYYAAQRAREEYRRKWAREVARIEDLAEREQAILNADYLPPEYFDKYGDVEEPNWDIPQSIVRPELTREEKLKAGQDVELREQKKMGGDGWDGPRTDPPRLTTSTPS